MPFCSLKNHPRSRKFHITTYSRQPLFRAGWWRQCKCQGHSLTHLFLDKMAAILAYNIFKRIFLIENIQILIKISPKFVLKGPINKIPALVQIMAWRRPCHYLNQCWPGSPTHICGTRGRWVDGKPACVHLWSGSSLAQVMACWFSSNKP